MTALVSSVPMDRLQQRMAAGAAAVPAVWMPTAEAVSVPANCRVPRWGSHIPALDGLRGIAILMVVVYHFAQGSHHNAALNYVFKIINAGWCGVDLFFVLSGFLITGILIDAKGRPHALRNFYMRRVLRIFPLYYGVLIAAMVIAPAFSSTALKDGPSQLWLWLYGANLRPLFDSSPSAYANVLGLSFGHFWSLAMEEQFYLFWPFVVLFTGRRTLLWICGLAIAMSLSLRCVLVGMHVSVDVVYQFTLCRMDALAAGAFLAAFVRGTQRLRQAVVFARYAVWAAAAFFVAMLLWRRNLNAWDPVMQTVGYTIVALFFSGYLLSSVTCAPSGMSGRICNSAPLRFLGKYSYGLYVFHHLPLPLIYGFGEVLRGTLHSYVLMNFVRLTLAGAVCVCVAVASWHLYEKHFIRLKARFA